MHSTAVSSAREPRPFGNAVLVGWDGSDRGADALELGRVLAADFGAKPSLVCVAAGVVRDKSAATTTLEAVGDSYATAVVSAPTATRGLAEAARLAGASVVVLGSSHRGTISQTLFGTKAEQLIHERVCPVAVAPRGYANRYANRALRVVLAGFDGTDEAHYALEVAADVVAAAGGHLRVLAIVEPPPLVAAGAVAFDYEADAEAERRRLVTAGERAVAGLTVPHQLDIDSGRPEERLAAASAAGVDLLVIGSMAYGRFGRAFLGGILSSVITSARCPVLIVPLPAERAPSNSSD